MQEIYACSDKMVPITDRGQLTKTKTSQHIYEPWKVISNNVAFWQVLTRTSLCSLLLSLETPNDVRSDSSLTLIDYSSE